MGFWHARLTIYARASAVMRGGGPARGQSSSARRGARAKACDGMIKVDLQFWIAGIHRRPDDLDPAFLMFSRDTAGLHVSTTAAKRCRTHGRAHQ